MYIYIYIYIKWKLIKSTLNFWGSHFTKNFRFTKKSSGMWIVTSFWMGKIRRSRGTWFCRVQGARSKTSGLTMKGGRTAPKTTKNQATGVTFERLLGSTVRRWDFRCLTVGSLPSSTSGACCSSTAARQSNEDEDSTNCERREEGEKLRENRIGGKWVTWPIGFEWEAAPDWPPCHLKKKIVDKVGHVSHSDWPLFGF